MGYSKEIKTQASNIIETRRRTAEREADYRKNKIYNEIPQAKTLEQQIASCGISAGRAVLRGGNVKEELEKLKEKSLLLQSQLNDLLASKGYSIKDTEPQYTCKKCNDKGYIEKDNKTVKCDCLKQILVECACNELNKYSPLSLCTFEDFNLDYYDKEKEDGFPRSSYEQMTMVLDFCKKYADSFNTNSASIFMKGSTGLGKTHLSLSIANQVIKKGFGVIYVSAPSLVAQLEKEHFSYDKSNQATEQALLETDLLIIDDLGSEFSTQFSTSTIYNIFNSRLLSHKPVIVNTNFNLSELEDMYTQRFVSRIVGEAKRLDFFGRDIRIKKSN